MTTIPLYQDLCASICDVLQLLTSRRDEGIVSVRCRTISGIDSGQPLAILASDVDERFIPAPLLRFLEDEPPWALHAEATLRNPPGGDDDLDRLGVVVASHLVEGVTEPHSPMALSSEHAKVAYDRIHRFPLAPTAVIIGGTPSLGGGYTMTALYALEEPLAVAIATKKSRTVALDISRGLAESQGATLPEALSELLVPVPGSAIREDRGENVVRVTQLERDRKYSLDEIKRAIREATK